MIQEPLVSIICTVYNKEPWLVRTIESFLSQEVSFPVEIILIDDASTDNSVSILKEYQERYPDKIRTIFHQENQGISKTWVEVCREARGFYIARSDADDFWLDNQKLQKQVDLLASRSDSRWSNTDFDIYNEYGEEVLKAGFATGAIPLADTFEKMLVTRGFTMASTWLVERELMLEVNEELDIETSDDTFNLQLSLFQRTKLAFLADATVAFTVNQGSDSRPQDFHKLKTRFNKLLATQNAYLDKYPESDYREMLRILLDRNNTYELILTQQEAGLEQLGFEKVMLFYGTECIFSPEQSTTYPLAKNADISIVVPEDCNYLRVDLSERPSFYSNVSLVEVETGTELQPIFTNGIQVRKHVVFPLSDPQIIYAIPTELYGRTFVLHYEVMELNNLYSPDYIGCILGQELLDAVHQTRYLQGEFARLKSSYQTLEKQVMEQTAEIATLRQQQSALLGSRRWIIPTKIINFLRREK